MISRVVFPRSYCCFVEQYGTRKLAVLAASAFGLTDWGASEKALIVAPTQLDVFDLYILWAWHLHLISSHNIGGTWFISLVALDYKEDLAALDHEAWTDPCLSLSCRLPCVVLLQGRGLAMMYPLCMSIRHPYIHSALHCLARKRSLRCHTSMDEKLFRSVVRLPCMTSRSSLDLCNPFLYSFSTNLQTSYPSPRVASRSLKG